MHIHVNGELRDIADGLTVAALLDALAIRGERVAVEVNLEILDRATFASRVLQAGDKVEILSFIGGGGPAQIALERHGR